MIKIFKLLNFFCNYRSIDSFESLKVKKEEKKSDFEK